MSIRLEPSAAPQSSAQGWLLIVTSMIGVSLSGSVIYALGQFMAPLEAAFGWSRTQTSVGVSISALGTCLISAFLGRLVDRVNLRHIAIPGVLLCSISIAAFSLNNGDF